MGPGSAILVYVQNLSAVLNDPSGAVPINFYPLFFSDNKGVWLSSTKLCLISQAFCIEIDLGLGDAVAKKYSRQMNMKREKIDRMEAQFFAFAFVIFPPINHHGNSESMGFYLRFDWCGGPEKGRLVPYYVRWISS